LTFYASIIVHEFSHAGMAYRFGVKTRRVHLFLLGAMAQLESMPDTAGREFLVALAGPVASFLLAVVLFCASFAINGIKDDVLSILATLNLIIAVFNMLPAYPMDGGRILKAIAWGISGDRLTGISIASGFAKVMAGGFAGLALLALFGVSTPVTGAGFQAAIMPGVLALFVFWGSSASKEAETDEALRGMSIPSKPCPDCESTDIKTLESPEVVKINGEEYNFTFHHRECQDCKRVFDDMGTLQHLKDQLHEVEAASEAQ
jgi:Zn-dependent protease